MYTSTNLSRNFPFLVFIYYNNHFILMLCSLTHIFSSNSEKNADTYFYFLSGQKRQNKKPKTWGGNLSNPE